MTARLVDPAPLEALLRESVCAIERLVLGGCQPNMEGNPCPCKHCQAMLLRARIEAALGGQSDE